MYMYVCMYVYMYVCMCTCPPRKALKTSFKSPKAKPKNHLKTL